MIRSVRSLMIIAGLMLGGLPRGYGQDVSVEDVVAIGSVRVAAEGPTFRKRAVLHDEERGDVELMLSPALVRTIDEYPAESFEVEGTITKGQMTVKDLRPIE